MAIGAKSKSVSGTGGDAKQVPAAPLPPPGPPPPAASQGANVPPPLPGAFTDEAKPVPTIKGGPPPPPPCAAAGIAPPKVPELPDQKYSFIRHSIWVRRHQSIYYTHYRVVRGLKKFLSRFY